MTDEADSDRFRDLSEREQRVAAMRRDGENLVDRQGRARVFLGGGPQSGIIIGSVPMQRRRAPPVSDTMGQAEFRRLYEAVATANLHGWVLNTFVTISWEVSGAKGDAYIRSLHIQWLALFRKWCDDWRAARPDMDVPHAGIWVREVGRHLGLHSHYLVHVPYDLRHKFNRWCKRTAHRLAETPVPDWRVRPADKVTLVHPSPNFHDDTEAQWRVFRYLTKALDGEATLRLTAKPHYDFLLAEFADVKPVAQGRIVGPRSGKTRTLAIGSRRALEARIGRFEVWPEYANDGQCLRYDASFLHGGMMGRSLAELEY